MIAYPSTEELAGDFDNSDPDYTSQDGVHPPAEASYKKNKTSKKADLSMPRSDSSYMHDRDRISINIPIQGTALKRCFKKPPWWASVLMAIGFIILILLFVLIGRMDSMGSSTMQTTGISIVTPSPQKSLDKTALIKTPDSTMEVSTMPALETSSTETPSTTIPGSTIEITTKPSLETMSTKTPSTTIPGSTIDITAMPSLETTSTETPTTIPVFTDCKTAMENGHQSSGVYTINPNGDEGTDTQPFQVYCEQQLDGGGWLVFQRRYDGSVDFYRDWATYKAGFGSLQGEFWLGNEYIHRITQQHQYELKIEMKSPSGEVQYADYRSFSIADEVHKYRLTYDGYRSGNPPGDSLHQNNGFAFSTRDQDNDRWRGFCAVHKHGGWWYPHCGGSNLNGEYGSVTDTGMSWQRWKGLYISMRSTRMMMRRKT